MTSAELLAFAAVQEREQALFTDSDEDDHWRRTSPRQRRHALLILKEGFLYLGGWRGMVGSRPTGPWAEKGPGCRSNLSSITVAILSEDGPFRRRPDAPFARGTRR